MSNRVHPGAAQLAKSLRPQMVVLPWLQFATVVVVAYEGIAFGKLWLGLTLLLCVYGIAAIQNDLADEAIDRANKRKDIPLATGDVTPAQLERLMIGLAVAATLIAGFLGVAAWLWTAVYLFLAWAYSGPLNLKSRGVLALVPLGLCYGFLPWMLGLIASATLLNWLTLGTALAAGGFATGITALKDFKDRAGDEAAGKRTLLVRYGDMAVRRFVVGVTTLSYLGLVGLLTVLGSYGPALAGMGVAGYSAWILMNAKIATTPHYRAKYGHRARTLFVAFACISFVLAAR